MSTDHERFMEMALEEARKGEAKGNGPVGSVIVKDGVFIAGGYNKAISDLDVTSHAETDAMRNAGPALGHTDLSGCTLYTTQEPCMMCAGAIVFAGIDTLVMGGNYNKNYGTYGDYSVEKAFEMVERGSIKVIRGVLVDECEAIGWNYKVRMKREAKG
jgi:tRNA(adenine34) deaminase